MPEGTGTSGNSLGTEWTQRSITASGWSEPC